MKDVRPRRRRPGALVKEVTALVLLLTSLVVALRSLADAVIQLGSRLSWW